MNARSVSVVRASVALHKYMGMPFKLRDLDCEKFNHGYGPECSNVQRVLAIWNMHILDVRGKYEILPFYTTHGDEFILLGNEVFRKSNLIGENNLFVIPSDEEIFRVSLCNVHEPLAMIYEER